MSDVQDSDWAEPSIPVPRPDPIRPGPRGSSTASERVPLRDYLEMRLANADAQAILRIESLGKELQVAIAASEKAVDKAEADMSRRLEGMNEFREQLNRQAATFVTKDELNAQRVAILSEVANARAAMESKLDAQYKILWTMAGAVAGLQAAIAYLSG